MIDNHPFLTIIQSNDEAISWATRRLNRVGLNVMRTFDLQVARNANTECPCPHHGSDQCDCQMVVLLVYGDDNQPISMVTHSFDGRTWFSLVDSPQQHADPRLEAAIVKALITPNIASFQEKNS